MSDAPRLLMQASVVALGARALAIEGPPGSGKSSLALALIDQGARLIGDDGASLTREGNRLIAGPPPNTSGLIEVRGVGLISLEVAPPAPLSLVLSLGQKGQRLPENLERRDMLGVAIPVLPFEPGAIAPAIRAQYALEQYGLPLS